MNRLRSAACVVALMALALALVIGHVHSYTEVSPVDELPGGRRPAAQHLAVVGAHLVQRLAHEPGVHP